MSGLTRLSGWSTLWTSTPPWPRTLLPNSRLTAFPHAGSNAQSGPLWILPTWAGEGGKEAACACVFLPPSCVRDPSTLLHKL